MQAGTILPATREAPEYLLRRLRRIDPDTVLEYLGEGTWALGVIKPRWRSPDGNYQRRATGALLVAEQRMKPCPHWPTLRMGLLMMEGFGLLKLCQITGEPDAQLLDWLATVDWNYRHRQAELELQMFREISDDAGMAKQKAAIADWARHEGPQVFRHAMLHRKSVTMARRAGLTPGAAR